MAQTMAPRAAADRWWELVGLLMLLQWTDNFSSNTHTNQAEARLLHGASVFVGISRSSSNASRRRNAVPVCRLAKQQEPVLPSPPQPNRNNPVPLIPTTISNKEKKDTTTATASISVTPIQSIPDVVALANLRYDEWIQGGIYGSDVSRESFQRATLDMVQERSNGGAVAFLARMKKSINKDGEDTFGTVVVGAAEVSPIELEGVLQHQRRNHETHQQNENKIEKKDERMMLYVTDVVTDRNHRRLGVAYSLMMAMEEHARVRGCHTLLLHVVVDDTAANPPSQSTSTSEENPSATVCSSNAAMNFYQSPKLGYRPWVSSSTIPGKADWTLNVERLARNAGIQPHHQTQVLMYKSIGATMKTTTTASSIPKRVRSGRGFIGSVERLLEWEPMPSF